MPFNLTNRDLLSLVHHSERDLLYLIDLARDLKRAKYSGDTRESLKGKNIALIFEKTSTRTRCAFEVAAYDEGAHVTYIDPSSSQIGHKGIDEGHRPGARPDVRRHRVSRRRTGDRRGAGALRRRSGVQRPDRRVPPDPDAGRRADDDRAQLETVARHRLCLRRGRPQQHGQLAVAGRRETRHGRADRGAQGSAAGQGSRQDVPGLRQTVRRPHHDHRRPEEGRQGRRLHPHRRLGVDG